MATHLSQLASQVPGILNEHSKRRRDPPDLSQYFDFRAFYGDEEPSSSGTRTRSVASSDPGLTSGPSEEDGAPSPGPSFDTFYHKDDIKQAKQHDDRFTVPKPDIRPKGGLPYPSKIHLDNVPSPTSSSPVGNNVMVLSAPGSPTTFNVPAGDNHPPGRGRRTRPLDNPEKVAGMRKLGACFRCKQRKIQCDEGAPCSACAKDAAKNRHTGCDNLAEEMCFRYHPRPMFREIGTELRAKNTTYSSSRTNTSTNCTFSVFFQPLMACSPPLMLKVDHGQYNDSSHFPRMGGKHHRYVLSAEDVEARQRENDIVNWASSQMKLEGNDSFQSALDNLVIPCAEYGQRELLPHSDLLSNVHRLRCLYKAWRQNSFVCQKQPGCEVEELPHDIHRSLKALLARAIGDVEKKVLEKLSFSEYKPKTQPEILLMWVCWMQIILLYRDLATIDGSQAPLPGGDLQQRAESLMNYAVVMCHLHCSKKKPVSMAKDDINSRTCLSSWFEKAESQLTDFFAEVRQQGRISDRVLNALLVPRSNMRALKRPRR